MRENLTLAAQLKLSKDYTLREKFERVEQVMAVVSTCTYTFPYVFRPCDPTFGGEQRNV